MRRDGNLIRSYIAIVFFINVVSYITLIEKYIHITCRNAKTCCEMHRLYPQGRGWRSSELFRGSASSPASSTPRAGDDSLPAATRRDGLRAWWSVACSAEPRGFHCSDSELLQFCQLWTCVDSHEEGAEEDGGEVAQTAGRAATWPRQSGRFMGFCWCEIMTEMMK